MNDAFGVKYCLRVSSCTLGEPVVNLRMMSSTSAVGFSISYEAHQSDCGCGSCVPSLGMLSGVLFDV